MPSPRAGHGTIQAVPFRIGIRDVSIAVLESSHIIRISTKSSRGKLDTAYRDQSRGAFLLIFWENQMCWGLGDVGATSSVRTLSL